MDARSYELHYQRCYEAICDIDYKWRDWDDATESVLSETKKITAQFNDEIQEASAAVTAAYTAKKYEECLKALDNMEAVIKKWQDTLNKLPPDTKLYKAGKMTAKVVALVASMAILANQPKLTGFVSNMLHKYNCPRKILPIVAAGAETVINGNAQRVVATNIMSFLMKRLTNAKKEESANPMAANSGDRNWENAMSNVSQWLPVIEEMRNCVKEDMAKAKGKKKTSK